VVEANLEPPSFGSGRQHGASIVGHDEADRLPQALRESAAPAGGTDVGAIQIILATLGNAALRDRRWG
jgi:hypothetical protein